MNKLEELKNSLIEEVNKRMSDKIIEPTNAELLVKLINNADSETEALAIAELGTTYRRTGFHFDKRLEKMGSDIKYLAKNDSLSFVSDKTALTHKLIIGDNYDALRQLLITHKGKIDMIYIDPPYGCNDLGESADTNYMNAITRDNLLSMLYPRVHLAKELLSEDGVIFCSIDDKNMAYVKCLFDEIFTENNFVCNLIWQTKQEAKGIPPTTMCVINCEYILVYSKSGNYKFIGDRRNVEDGFTNPDNDPRGPWKRQYLQRFGQGFPVRTIVNPENGMSFSFETPYTEEKMNNWIKEGCIIFPKENTKYPAKKEYFYEYDNPYKPIVNNLGLFSTKVNSEKLKSLFGGEKVFEYSKPLDLMKNLLLKSVKKDAKILDFYAGSGTTGHAVLDLNKEDGGTRQFILCTNNEVTKINSNGIAYDVTSKRLKRVMTGFCYDGSTDFKWQENNEPYGDNLEVYEIEKVNNTECREGKSAFEVIDETLYDLPKFTSIEEKINWVCNNFENTQKYLKGE